MKIDPYVALDFQDIPTAAPVSRREFFKRFGAGIFIFVCLGNLLGAAEPERPRGRRGGGLPSDFNAFLRIGEDGQVTGYTGKIEMGQGPITSLPQMLAEELEVPLAAVHMVMGDTELCPWDMGTFGSQTTRNFGPALRAAAAEAKAVLVELAAEALQVPQDQLVAKNGRICDRQNADRCLTYAQLAKGQKIARQLKGRPALKEPAQFKIVGQPQYRRDALEKVTGKALYAADVRVPGMLYAKILRPPAHGAKLKRVEVDSCKTIPGVQVVQEGDLVAVLHEFPDMAEAALAKIKAEFDLPEPHVNDQSIFDHLLGIPSEPRVVASGGDLQTGQKLATKKIQNSYLNSYVAHAPMEPHAALAQIEGDKATVWASTQNPFGAQREIAEAIGFPAEKVRVIAPYVGGGFGGKTANLQAVEAARLAKASGKPVQVMRSREEEFFYDNFRPAAIVKIHSGIDDAGKLVFWDYDVFYAGERGSQQFYAIPHHRTASHGSAWGGGQGTHPFATGAWRGPGNNTNTFARESHIDVMAAAAGIDPVAFRLQNLTDRKMIRVLQAATQRFGWTPAKAPSHRGFGVACGIDAGTFVALAVEVAVNTQKGTVQVQRVTCAQDMGVVINPEGARIQVEGCVTMGLGYALTEEIRFQGGKILDTNFDTYELPRFSWVPKIETVLLNSQEAPQGGGEPAIILMGAALANAVYDATGARLLQLPMTPERIKAALQKA